MFYTNMDWSAAKALSIPKLQFSFYFNIEVTIKIYFTNFFYYYYRFFLPSRKFLDYESSTKYYLMIRDAFMNILNITIINYIYNLIFEWKFRFNFSGNQNYSIISIKNTYKNC